MNLVQGSPSAEANATLQAELELILGHMNDQPQAA